MAQSLATEDEGVRQPCFTKSAKSEIPLHQCSLADWISQCNLQALLR